MSKVDTKRDEYLRAAPDWKAVRDVVAGERTVRDAKTQYLPRPNPSDESKDAADRYEQYLTRASFFNATGRTLQGMVGIAFRRWPEIVLPPALKPMLDDADGAGSPIVNQSQRVVKSVMKTGRCGLLTDFTTTSGAQSVADQRSGNARATITIYEAESIINWRRENIGGRSMLTLVVLSESVETADGFKTGSSSRYRELALGRLLSEDDTAPRRYVMRVWSKDEHGNDVIESEIEPKKGDGTAWGEIPFAFVGANDNDETVDKAPLLDMAWINLSHWRSSADFQEAAFFLGQPQIYASGLTQNWIDKVWDKSVYFGSRVILPLPEGASAGVLQAAPNTMAKESMDIAEARMIALGARLLTPGSAVMTAEQSRSESAAAHSVLSLVVDNVSSAYTKALRWAAVFMRADEADIAFDISTDFTGLQADPNLIVAIVTAWQAGKLPTSDANAALRQLGLIAADKDDEAVEEELGQQTAGLGLDQ